MTRASASLGIMVLASGCVVGPEVATFGPSSTPAGLDITIELDRRKVSGELLAVEDTALVLVVRSPSPDSSDIPRIARVATRRIRAMLGQLKMRGAWNSTQSARFRSVARYPQGITPELEARLVAAYQVDQVRWLP